MADAETALHRLLRRLFVFALGTDSNFFRPEGQRAPAGPASAPYATVNLYLSEVASYNLRRWAYADPVVAAVRPALDPAPDLLEVMESLDRVTVSVQFWRDGAVDGAGRAAWGETARARALSLVRRLEMSPVVERANEYGLAYAGASAVRDVSGVVDGNYERRAQVDLTFYVANAEVLSLGMFREASLDVKIQQPDGHISEVSA